MSSRFDADGYEVLRGVVSAPEIENFRAEFDPSSPGDRLFFVAGAIGECVANGSMAAIAAARLGPTARPVRLILFNKSAETNWNLGWHQDRVIAVKERVDVEEFSNWSRKHCALHCAPPFDLIRGMITIRLHCDASNSENGALEVIPGSHRLGLLSDDETCRLADEGMGELIECEAGDALVLATSIVHRSRTSKSSKPRRVIHVDYSADRLPAPLDWAFSMGSSA
jgi:hypothetical protein